MANQPYLPLYTGDWKKDPDLSLCSTSTRGIWIDMLCSLHDGRIGQVTGTPEQLARLCRCNAAEMHAALHELQATKAADVSEREGVFTVACRRMKKAIDISRIRAESGSKGGAKGKQKESCPDIEGEDGGIERVREFGKSRGVSTSDCDWFYWKGRGNGWTNGGKPMLDWKATLLSWQRAGYLPSQKQRNGQFRSDQKKPAPIGEAYQRPPPAREPTEAELKHAREIAKRETDKLRQQLGSSH